MKERTDQSGTELPAETRPEKILCLYSGGSDSTLAALMAANLADTVYLVTYERFGLFASKRSTNNLLRLRKRFPNTQFIHMIVNFEKEYRRIAYSSFWSDRLKFGFIPLSVCGLCKLGMHWKTITLCRNHDVHVVYDGATKATEIFPAQNYTIMIEGLKRLYREHDIAYETPVYNLDTQKELFKEKLIPSDRIKGTAKDIQPLCSQQLLFVRFVDYYLSKHSFDKYVSDLKRYYDVKIDQLRELLINA